MKSTLSGLAVRELPLVDLAKEVTTELVSDSPMRETTASYLETMATQTGSESLADLLKAACASLDAAEQELELGAVNILTMHQAKGLGAGTVIIVGHEG